MRPWTSGTVNFRTTATLSSGSEIDTTMPQFDPYHNGAEWVLTWSSRGIRANASMVGDGEDIMATVMVGDTVVHSAPLKVADVTEGLDSQGRRQ